MITEYLRQPAIAAVTVAFMNGFPVPCLQKAYNIRREVRPPACFHSRVLDIFGQCPVFQRSIWLGHVARQQVVEGGHIRRTLDGGMSAQCHNTTSWAANIPQQQLYHGCGADNLHSFRLLRPTNRVAESRSAFPA